MSKFYVYQLVDPRTNNIFYVGKGSGKRAFSHTNAVRSGRKDGNSQKQAVISEILQAGLEPKVIFVSTNLQENAAYILEEQIITNLGIITEGGILTNICKVARPPNNRGISLSERVGVERADEIKRAAAGRLKARLAGKSWDQLYGPEKSLSMKANVCSRMKISSKNNPNLFKTGHEISDDTKLQMSRRMKNNNPMKGKTHSASSKDKISRNHADVRGVHNPSAKCFEIKDSFGNIHVVIADITGFCKKHSIEYSSLLSAFKQQRGCRKGKSKGWEILSMSRVK